MMKGVKLMIEFNGYITGNAEKYFIKKTCKITWRIFFLSWLLMLPIVLRFCNNDNSLLLFLIYFCILLFISIIIYFPKKNKYINSIKPKHIYILDGNIVSVSEKNTESKLIADIKKIYDFGEFYEIVFPIGKISDKYICQKNLIQNSTIKDFENMFSDKIIRSFN